MFTVAADLTEAVSIVEVYFTVSLAVSPSYTVSVPIIITVTRCEVLSFS